MMYNTCGVNEPIKQYNAYQKKSTFHPNTNNLIEGSIKNPRGVPFGFFIFKRDLFFTRQKKNAYTQQ